MKHYTKKEIADRLKKAFEPMQNTRITPNGPTLALNVRYRHSAENSKENKIYLDIVCKRTSKYGMSLNTMKIELPNN